MGQPVLDPQEFLDQLKAEGQVLHWMPLDPPDLGRAPKPEPVRTKEGLEYLHHHWVLPDRFEAGDAGPGLRGRVLGLVGQIVYRVLGRYLSEERELLSHLVQVNAALERRCDQLAQRCDEITRDVTDRQVAEAANQAILAAWLHAAPLAGGDRLGDPGGNGRHEATGGTAADGDRPRHP